MTGLAVALIAIDVQQGFDVAEHWGPRNNPECETNIRRLLDAWRAVQQPVVLVRHDSEEPGSPLSPDGAGNAFKPGIEGAHAVLVVKHVNSAFHGTPDLRAWLRARGIQQIVVCGITTNHCCETTARVGGNLGFDVQFVLDATHTFDRVGPDGVTLRADALAQATATNLHDEFATIVSTTDLLRGGIRSAATPLTARPALTSFEAPG